ncbi:MAG: hypothetical protein GXY08_06055 [Ruminococcus sp.]|nr:hypothetical protein [Ruminococcus sp.]
MKRKEKEALKNAFGIPEPLGADAFFERPEFAEKKEDDRSILLFHRIPAALRYGSIALAAVAVIGLWGGFKNWAKTDKFDKNDQPGVTETTASAEPATDGYGHEIIVTTSGEQTVVDIVTTTAAEPEDNDTVTTTASGDDGQVNVTTAAGNGTKRTTAVKPGNGRTTTTAVRPPSKRTTTATGGHHNRTTTTAVKPPAVQTTTKRTSVPLVTTTPGTYPVVLATTSPKDEGPVPSVTDPIEKGGGDDRTVRPGVVYNVNGKVVGVNEIMAVGSNSDPQPDGPTPDRPTDSAIPVKPVTELVRSSNQVIIGEVEEIIFTSENGYPVTQTNIRVSQSLYGSLSDGDIISVRSSGGYMPVKDYAPAKQNGYPYEYRDYYVVDYRRHQFNPSRYNEYVFFLENDGDIFRLCTDDGESVYQDTDGSGRYRCWADESFSTTYRKITDAIATYK